MLNRRYFLKSAAAFAAGGATMNTLAPGLGAFRAHAADTGGYKALVCLFLLGGLDGHDLLIPYDQSSYDTYADLRSALMGLYAGQPTNPRARENLLPLAPENAADFPGREFALPPEMPGIHGLFQNGNAAVVSNVGPLIQPVTAAEVLADSAPVPSQLFSHNDQQSTWMSSAPEGAQFGWGGRFADAVAASSSQERDFTSITTLGNELFLTGTNTAPYQVGLDGAQSIDILEFFSGNPYGLDEDLITANMRQHFLAAGANDPNLIERDMAAAINGSLTKNEAFNAALEAAPVIGTMFPNSFLGSQLRAVAQTIATRDALLMNRQIFFVAIGGFDTHANQAGDLPNLLGQIDGAVTAFMQAVGDMGLANDVTLFTASDFGRTLAINGDGTDHGWGSHHLVVGGGVQGNRIYGEIPPYIFDHDYDVGGGRLVPTLSVEQFAAPLGSWFGLDSSELATALPGLSAFPSGTPGLFV